MSSRNAFRFIPVMSAVMAASILSTAASAAEPSGITSTMAVRYGAGELADSASAQNLYARIRSAARSVCGSSGRTIDEQREWQTCYRSALDGAVTAVHSPLLDTLHREQDPRFVAML
jgi:UrcA family protein